MDDPGKLLKIVADHERTLQFDSFSATLAWEIGSLLRSDALARSASMTFEIQLAGRTLFACATDGAPAGQADWIRRKRNTVMRFSRSSYAIGLQLDLEGKTLEARHGLSLADYAAHGGGFPILLKGTGCVGSIVASGLTQQVDHQMVVTAIASALRIDPPISADEQP